MHTEPKCKLFSWLALYEKLLMTDMLAPMGCPQSARYA
jgi:hypothetical protein